jgi:DNA-damage-inducible protein J
MAKEATLQVRMDADLKEQVEALYKRMGSSFAEAVRIFARQSVEDNAMPFTMHLSRKSNTRVLGIANGKYDIPDDIDEFDKEIAKTFWVDEGDTQ